jgi:hypothetical protein
MRGCGSSRNLGVVQESIRVDSAFVGTSRSTDSRTAVELPRAKQDQEKGGR